MQFAVIDIETTGGNATNNKIIEIAVVVHDGQKIIKTWESLINPETYIPSGITELTLYSIWNYGINGHNTIYGC
ncbi:MAG: hypothetical protein RJA90_1697 [Bacteroidota bacterium]